MATDEKDDVQEALQGYKAKIIPTTKAMLTWSRDLVFEETTPQGYELEFDAEAQWGCKPTEALLMSPGGCMSIDIVSILKKMPLELTRDNLHPQAHLLLDDMGMGFETNIEAGFDVFKEMDGPDLRCSQPRAFSSTSGLTTYTGLPARYASIWSKEPLNCCS
jgi:hypothetical protein